MTRQLRSTRSNTERLDDHGPSWCSLLGKYRHVLMMVLGTLIGVSIATIQQQFTSLSFRNKDHHRQYSVSNNTTFITVILVLGEKLVDGGKPSANLKSRIETAQKVADEPRHYHDGSISHGNDVVHVILTGGDTAMVNRTEASVMKEMWSKKERQGDVTITYITTLHLEQQSKSTCQNAFYSIPILQQIQQQHRQQNLHIVLVTSDYHVARAKILFEQVFQTILLPTNSLNNIVRSLQIDNVMGAPTANKKLRKELFLNERRWLQPKNIQILLEQMDDHPFALPTKERLQQAVTELEQYE